MEETRLRRFALVNAGHHFLIRALPFRAPESRLALDAFTECLCREQFSSFDVETVLLRCLAVMGRHTSSAVPSLVDRFLRQEDMHESAVKRFRNCVEHVLRCRGIDNPLVYRAIELIEQRFVDPTLAPRSLANALGVRLSSLCVAFKRDTGLTISQRIRLARLQRAARLLVASTKSVKEVWCAVGYGDASNFTHDFKATFGASPRAYRASALQAGSMQVDGVEPPAPREVGDHDNITVLVADSDASTRGLLSTFLSRPGVFVTTAASGAEALNVVARVRPRVLLLDSHLPDMDATDFLEKSSSLSHPRPATAVFTADLEILDHPHEINTLGALVLSKLCDLEQILELVLYLSDANNVDLRQPCDAPAARSRDQPSALLKHDGRKQAAAITVTGE